MFFSDHRTLTMTLPVLEILRLLLVILTGSSRPKNKLKKILTYCKTKLPQHHYN